MTTQGVRAMIDARVRKAGSTAALAQEWELSPQYIHAVSKSRVEPGKLILSRLGLERVVSYRAKEKP